MKCSKIKSGTIGSRPCEIALNDILIKISDSKITRAVMSRYNDLRMGLRKLEQLTHVAFRKNMGRLLYREIKTSLSNINAPPLVISHTLCCLAALYRDWLRTM